MTVGELRKINQKPYTYLKTDKQIYLEIDI